MVIRLGDLVATAWVSISNCLRSRATGAVAVNNYARLKMNPLRRSDWRWQYAFAGPPGAATPRGLEPADPVRLHAPAKKRA